MQLGNLNPDIWKPEAIRERTVQGELLQCVETKPDFAGGKSGLCFGKTTGLQVERVVPNELLEGLQRKRAFIANMRRLAIESFLTCFVAMMQGI